MKWKALLFACGLHIFQSKDLLTLYLFIGTHFFVHWIDFNIIKFQKAPNIPLNWLKILKVHCHLQVTWHLGVPYCLPLMMHLLLLTFSHGYNLLFHCHCCGNIPWSINDIIPSWANHWNGKTFEMTKFDQIIFIVLSN